MADNNPKVLKIAKTLVADIKPMMDKALAALGVDLKKDEKEYYKTSRDLLRAVVACAAQKMMEDGANRSLVSQTIREHATGISEDAWALYLESHPEVMEKIKAEKAKATEAEAKTAANFKKANPLKVVQGGLNTPAEEAEDSDEGGGDDDEEPCDCGECEECDPSADGV